MPPVSSVEASLDAALAEALFGQPEFAKWFLGRTRFRDEAAECVFCRSDNPWSTVRLERPNPGSGELEVLSKQCETDVLAVFQTKDGRRLALHIENKLATGNFTHLQPELYKQRLQQWKNRPKLGQYSDATSVLVAPEVFVARYRTQAQLFEAYVSHEELAQHVPAFTRGSAGGA
jgi:hypothetical protein